MRVRRAAERHRRGRGAHRCLSRPESDECAAWARGQGAATRRRGRGCATGRSRGRLGGRRAARRATRCGPAGDRTGPRDGTGGTRLEIGGRGGGDQHRFRERASEYGVWRVQCRVGVLGRGRVSYSGKWPLGLVGRLRYVATRCDTVCTRLETCSAVLCDMRLSSFDVRGAPDPGDRGGETRVAWRVVSGSVHMDGRWSRANSCIIPVRFLPHTVIQYCT